MMIKRLSIPLMACCAGLYAQDSTIQMLQKLADAPGPSGFEEPVRKLMTDYMQPLATSIRYDGMGSIIAAHGSTGPRVMVDAHMDELGGMIRRITPNGFLSMQMLGGWLDQALVDQRWVIIGSKGAVHAVTGIRDIHVIPADERTRVFPRDGLYLDVGAKSEAEVRAMGISPGDPVAPDAPFIALNGTDNYLAKAWDDRAGCAVIVEAMRRLNARPHPNQIFWTITTQEEIGLRGAHTAADVVKPDLAIALEAGITGDTFPGHPEETQGRLGAGPGLFLSRMRGSCGIARLSLVAFTKEIAAAKKAYRCRPTWCRATAMIRRDCKSPTAASDRQSGDTGALHTRAQRHYESPGLRSDGGSAGGDAREAGRGQGSRDPRFHTVAVQSSIHHARHRNPAQLEIHQGRVYRYLSGHRHRYFR